MPALEPGSGAARADLGFTLKRGDHIDEAVTELRKAVSLAPDLARAHFHLAEALSQVGDGSGALAEYQTAARLSPRDVEYRIKLGMALARAQPAGAVEELRKAVALDPDNVAAQRALGGVLRRTGENEAAAAAFERARQVSDAQDRQSQAVLHTNKGIELLKKEKLVEAIEALRLALAADPRHPAANHYLAIALTATGQWTQAEPAFVRALAGAPNDPEIHFNYGVALQRRGNWPRAADEFHACLRLRPGHPEANCRLAAALFHVRDNDAARVALDRARQTGNCQAEPSP